MVRWCETLIDRLKIFLRGITRDMFGIDAEVVIP